MPYFLKTLSFVGMVAMLWVGGGILVHGLHQLGVHGPEEAVHHAAEAFASLLPSAHGFMAWLSAAGIAAVLGVIIGALVDPLAKYVIQPLVARFKRR
jgi:predicted DNA repair protein MutK